MILFQSWCMLLAQYHLMTDKSLMVTMDNKGLMMEFNCGKSSKGHRNAKSILVVAEKLLVEEGYHHFTLRKIAGAAGISLGNLQYYYPQKDILVRSMLDNCIERYLVRLKIIRSSVGKDPTDQFVAIIREIICDLNTKHTSKFFPEIWVLSNHDDCIGGIMDDMYEKYRAMLIEVMTMMNPRLTVSQLIRLSIFISSSIEGLTLFIGHNKPFKCETENMISIATQSYLWLIHSDSISE